MLACPVSLDPLSYPLIFHIHCSTPSHPRFVIPFSNYASQSLLNVSFSFLPSQYRPNYHCCSDTDSTLLDIDDDDAYSLSVEGESSNSLSGDGVYIEIKKLERNARRIRSMIAIDASLDTIWDILTDYEKLVDFIPSLAVSKLIEKKNNFARLYQIGQQNLPFGLKFNAKGVLDCYEKDLERFPSTKKRDIEFKMIEGDFQVFEGKWSIEQIGQQNLPFGLKFNAKGVLDCYEKDLERFPFTKKRDIEFKMIEGDFQVFEGKWSIEQFNKGKCEEMIPYLVKGFKQLFPI